MMRRKQLAYEAASAMAKRALTIDERSAHAHFLYAAPLGSGEASKGFRKVELVLGELKAAYPTRHRAESDPPTGVANDGRLVR